MMDEVFELSCNLDDMTPEDVGFAMERLLEAGALDVYTLPIGMKKNRPGVMLCVLCKPEDRQRMAEELFRCTTTLGIRETAHGRYVLRRESRTRETPFGPVREKLAEGYGISRWKPEYEDIRRIALEQGLSPGQVREMIYGKEEQHD